MFFFEGVQAKYFILSGSKFRQVRFSDCDLEVRSWIIVRTDGVIFERTDLSDAGLVLYIFEKY